MNGAVLNNKYKPRGSLWWKVTPVIKALLILGAVTLLGGLMENLDLYREIMLRSDVVVRPESAEDIQRVDLSERGELKYEKITEILLLAHGLSNISRPFIDPMIYHLEEDVARIVGQMAIGYGVCSSLTEGKGYTALLVYTTMQGIGAYVVIEAVHDLRRLFPVGHWEFLYHSVSEMLCLMPLGALLFQYLMFNDDKINEIEGESSVKLWGIFTVIAACCVWILVPNGCSPKYASWSDMFYGITLKERNISTMECMDQAWQEDMGETVSEYISLYSDDSRMERIIANNDLYKLKKEDETKAYGTYTATMNQNWRVGIDPIIVAYQTPDKCAYFQAYQFITYVMAIVQGLRLSVEIFAFMLLRTALHEMIVVNNLQKYIGEGPIFMYKGVAMEAVHMDKGMSLIHHMLPLGAVIGVSMVLVTNESVQLAAWLSTLQLIMGWYLLGSSDPCKMMLGGLLLALSFKSESASTICISEVTVWYGIGVYYVASGIGLCLLAKYQAEVLTALGSKPKTYSDFANLTKTLRSDLVAAEMNFRQTYDPKTWLPITELFSRVWWIPACVLLAMPVTRLIFDIKVRRHILARYSKAGRIIAAL